MNDPSARLHSYEPLFLLEIILLPAIIDGVHLCANVPRVFAISGDVDIWLYPALRLRTCLETTVPIESIGSVSIVLRYGTH